MPSRKIKMGSKLEKLTKIWSLNSAEGAIEAYCCLRFESLRCVSRSADINICYFRDALNMNGWQHYFSPWKITKLACSNTVVDLNGLLCCSAALATIFADVKFNSHDFCLAGCHRVRLSSRSHGP